MMFTTATYRQRRKTLSADVNHGIILLPGNGESSMNYTDNLYHFRQDSSFLYFTGIDIPGLVLVMDIDDNSEYLFGTEATVEEMVWTGPRAALQEDAAKAGIRFVKPLSELASYLQEKQKKGQEIHYTNPYRAEITLQLSEWLAIPWKSVAGAVSVTLIRAIVKQRSIKSEEEITEIEKAVNITTAMHTAAIQTACAGMSETELAGILQGIAVSKGGQLAFPIILTVNGQYLHNHAGNTILENGQMVICDCGAEAASHYAGDMTRTFPVAKTFTTLQKELYAIVLQAHGSAVAALKPGVLFRDVHTTACEILTDGLKSLGLMKGDTTEAVRAGAHALFFQCGLGHMMGLDVHDMENLGEQYLGYTDDIKKSTQFGLKSLRLGRALEAGFVVTIEPGLYFNASLMDQWESQNLLADFIDYNKLKMFRQAGGIRIEDDYLVTPAGARLLGNPLASSPEDIEAMR